MKHSMRFFVVSSLSILVGFYGCSAPSSEAEMKAAQEAMDNAKSFHAESLAASNWNEAVISLGAGSGGPEGRKIREDFFSKGQIAV